MRGIDFAAEEINRSGGIDGRPVEIIRGDTEGDSGTARETAERLITEERVHAILGCHQSTLTEVVSQVCEEYRIPMITAISTVDSISTHGYEYFFRMCPMNSLYLGNMFMYMRDQEEKTGHRVKTIAVFADDSMIGQEAIRCARIYAPQYGMEIVKEICYSQGAADLTSEIRELKAAAGIGGLLALGIGDTLRVSLTADPVEEVYAARRILKAIGLRREGPEVIACPTCGRTQIELIPIAMKVEELLKGVDKPITVAVMGCVVNGPGEARHADVGLAGGKSEGVLFRRGEIVARVPEDQLVPGLMKLIENL